MHQIDDDPAWREYLARVVDHMPRFACGGLEQASIVVLELWHRGDDGFRLAAALKRRRNPPRLLALTSRCDEVALYRSMLGPLEGVVWKTPAAQGQLCEGLEALLADRSYFPPEVVAERRRVCASPDAYFKRLSPVELELMPYLGQFTSDFEIARQTGRSPATIRWHRGEIIRRLDLHDSFELVRWAMETGFVAPNLPAPPCLVGV
ncbi:MAG: response regulator transcription factor [Verrucomicrobia bacterium]|nr:response regulator transcription factor [Verrucomicrobiota bacterium]